MTNFSVPGLLIIIMVACVGFYASSLAYKAQGGISSCPTGPKAPNAIAALLTSGVIAATLGVLWLLEDIGLAKYLNPSEGGVVVGCAIVIAIGIVFTTNGKIVEDDADDSDECKQVRDAGKAVKIPGIVLLSVACLFALLTFYKYVKR